jgi:lauroyl/myristoyl acyltransferase
MGVPKQKSFRPLVYFRYTVEFLLMMVFNLILFVLPWMVTWRLGRGFGWMAYKLLTKRKSTVARNNRRAFPEKTDSE